MPNQRCSQQWSDRQGADILFVDEETISRWVRLYTEHGLAGLKNPPRWGGEHGPRWLPEPEVGQLRQVLEQEARPGTVMGSGWSVRAIRALMAERLQVHSSRTRRPQAATGGHLEFSARAQTLSQAQCRRAGPL